MGGLLLIANPRSQQNRKKLSKLEGMARRNADLVDYRRLESMSALSPALDLIEKTRPEILAISGGDGTLMACLTLLLEEKGLASQDIPAILALPSGMTNMSAADLTGSGTPEGLLETVLDQLRKGQSPLVHHRSVLRVQNIPGTSPQRGFFFGSAGIIKAIEFCRAKVHRLGFEAEWASGLAMSALVLGELLKGSLLEGEPIALSRDAGPKRDEVLAILLATTLDRLILRSRPFWSQAPGDFHHLTVDAQPKRRLRSLLPLLYGSSHSPDLPESYKSGDLDSLEIWQEGPFTIDGQLFEGRRDMPLKLTAQDRLTFVQVR